jgi:hypothetical protein
MLLLLAAFYCCLVLSAGCFFFLNRHLHLAACLAYATFRGQQGSPKSTYVSAAPAGRWGLPVSLAPPKAPGALNPHFEYLLTPRCVVAANEQACVLYSYILLQFNMALLSTANHWWCIVCIFFCDCHAVALW